MNRKRVLTLLILAWLAAACTSPTAVPNALPTGAAAPTAYPVYPSPLDQAGYIPWYPAPGTPGAPAAGVYMTTGFEPQPSDAALIREGAYPDLESSQLLILESYPIQVIAVVRGNLPDPCHLLRAAVTAADVENRIQLEVYSLVDGSMACTAVLEPFVLNIPLGTYSGGHFSVYINGELLGEFDS